VACGHGSKEGRARSGQRVRQPLGTKKVLKSWCGPGTGLSRPNASGRHGGHLFRTKDATKSPALPQKAAGRGRWMDDDRVTETLRVLGVLVSRLSDALSPKLARHLLYCVLIDLFRVRCYRHPDRRPPIHEPKRVLGLLTATL